VLSRIPALTLAESYRRREDYDYVAAFEQAARDVLGADLAAQVQRDILTLQDRGLDRLEHRRPILRTRYDSFAHAGAVQIVAWLVGVWKHAAEAVQTQ